MAQREEIFKKLADAVENYDADEAKNVALEALRNNLDPLQAVTKGLAVGMKRIGEKWQKLEVFMPEVASAADAFMEAMNVLRPRMTGESRTDFAGTMIIGTIFGDIHTVGKEVAIPVFQAEGINVIDLGVDVSAEKFVEAVNQYSPEIVGLGTYMSETFMNTSAVIEGLKNAGLRDKVKVICGGPAVNENLARKLGADDASNDAWLAIPKIKALVAEVKKTRN